MFVIATCQTCGKRIKAPGNFAGKTIPCPHRGCTGTIAMPLSNSGTPRPTFGGPPQTAHDSQMESGGDSGIPGNSTRWIALTIWGWVALGLCLMAMLTSIKFFTSPKYEGFWEDLNAYYLKKDGAKSIEQLYARYGKETAKEFVGKEKERTGLGAIVVPNDEAATTAAIAFKVEADPNRKYLFPEIKSVEDSVGLMLGCLTFLALLYWPALHSIKKSQLMMLELRLRNKDDSYWNLVREYFHNTPTDRVYLVLMPVGISLVLSLLDAAFTVTSDFRSQGVTVLDLTISFFFLGYLTGIWFKVISSLIDVGYLSTGRNPRKTLVDDLIAIVIVGSILLFVYDNSVLSVLRSSAVGLSGTMFLKGRQMVAERMI